MSAVNNDALVLFAKFGGAMLGLLLLIWLIAILTPKLAKLIDRLSGRQAEPPEPRPERVEDNIKSENYEVHSFFEDVPLKRQEDKKQEAGNAHSNPYN